jgi:hypothetical protein
MVYRLLYLPTGKFVTEFAIYNSTRSYPTKLEVEELRRHILSVYEEHHTLEFEIIESEH